MENIINNQIDKLFNRGSAQIKTIPPAGERASLEKVIDSETQENLGKDEFLKLLTVQLSHQDPLKPMSNTEFISQMAEFSALEQMKNMNTAVAGLKGEFSKLSNLNLVGKLVSFNDFTGELKTGLVERVSLGGEAEGKTKVTIAGKNIDLDKVTSVLNYESRQNKKDAYEKNLSSKEN